MSEEFNELAATAAPEQADTVSLVPDATLPEETTEAVAPKTFTQEELDTILGKRLAREQRKWEREQSQRTVESNPNAPLSPEQFQTTEAYIEAIAERKAAELVANREKSKHQSEILETYHDREEAARDKYDDFEQVVKNPSLPITDIMAEVIYSSEVGPDLAYHLGTNPKEAARISRLSPAMQAKELGKLEVKLASSPPVKKTSNAPAPINPVAAKGAGSTTFDTTDPRSIKSMSTSEWIEADRKRQIKKLEQRTNR